MLGAIIGDIVGSRFEFNPTNDYNFELFTDDSGFTDDTICTVAVADALLKGGDFGESIHEWCRRYPHPKGSYGGRFAQWVRSDAPQPYGSYGNGSAMRVSPIAWARPKLGVALRFAELSACCTHNHHEGILGAQTTVMAIHYGMEARANNKYVTKEQIKRILDKCVKYSGYNINIRKEDVVNRFDETCQGTVPVALWIIGQSSSFEDAIRRAVSLGADADTLGAIVGSIAEAIWGIPKDMQRKALEYLPDVMKDVVLQFYNRFVEKQTADDDEKEQSQAIMLWKLGLGDMGKLLNGEDPMPKKTKVAKASSWKTKPMPRTDISKVRVNIELSAAEMDIICRGHIPEAMEDHWFMYCDDEYIRYYRSWSGMCAFEAHFYKKADLYIIDELCINQALMEFGVNGDKSGVALFVNLIIAELGINPRDSWEEFLRIVDDTNQKNAQVADSPKEKPKPKESVFEPEIDDWNDWYCGVENHVCEGCIYTDGIRDSSGCGRLAIVSFKQRYTSGKCEYRKIDLFIPSEFEKERKEVALRKKHDEEKKRLRK